MSGYYPFSYSQPNQVPYFHQYQPSTFNGYHGYHGYNYNSIEYYGMPAHQPQPHAGTVSLTPPTGRDYNPIEYNPISYVSSRQQMVSMNFQGLPWNLMTGRPEPPTHMDYGIPPTPIGPLNSNHRPLPPTPPTPDDQIRLSQLPAWCFYSRVRVTCEQEKELVKRYAVDRYIPKKEEREELGERIGLSAERILVWFQSRRQKDGASNHEYRQNRIQFSREQTEALEKRFSVSKSIYAEERDKMAEEIGLSWKQIQNWFTGRRRKERRQMK
ncbi:unnamed protein product [Caenorhabditis sp. 36 PRJEB53466]|nr:unnamed protein product [Caenorhabditis sp. 36 PRJEB53466]